MSQQPALFCRGDIYSSHPGGQRCTTARHTSSTGTGNRGPLLLQLLVVVVEVGGEGEVDGRLAERDNRRATSEEPSR